MNKYFDMRSRCPGCNSSVSDDIYQNPYDESPVREYLNLYYSPQGGVDFGYLKNATYHLVKCRECDLIYQREIPSTVLMKILYEEWIDPEIDLLNWQDKWSIGTRQGYAKEVSIIIEHLRKPPSSLNFLDFGMGWGAWALMAKGFGCNSYGFELSDERIQYARSNGVKVLSWDEIPEHRFDFINTEQVFEHLANPLETLIYLKSSLNTNGIIKISVPTANDIKRRLFRMDWSAPRGTRNSLVPVTPLEHINCFSRTSLLRMANLAGMKEVCLRMKTQYKYITFAGGLRRLLVNLFLPVYRNILKKQNYLFFSNDH